LFRRQAGGKLPQQQKKPMLVVSHFRFLGRFDVIRGSVPSGPA
jgi:hypothetical protein